MKNLSTKKFSYLKNMRRMHFKHGFTLLELIISLAIFAFMTAFLLAKYGTFNQSVLLTDLAYDTAITIRNAQASALNVQGNAVSGSLYFANAYGVHFGGLTPSNSFVYYVNTSTSGGIPSLTYGSGAQTLSTYVMKSGDMISGICVQTEVPCLAADVVTSLDIAFQRPNPDAKMNAYSSMSGSTTPTYARITVVASDGSSKSVVIQSTGEVSVSN